MKTALLLNAADASTDQTSAPYDLQDSQEFSVQVTFSSATLNGVLTLQASLDGTNYQTITGSSQSVVSGEEHIWDANDASYQYVRVFWDASSGTGTLTATMRIKDTVIART